MRPKTPTTHSGALKVYHGLFRTSRVTGDQMRHGRTWAFHQNLRTTTCIGWCRTQQRGHRRRRYYGREKLARASIGLPANVILGCSKRRNDSSLFAMAPGNLDLINQDAVKARLNNNKRLQGKAGNSAANVSACRQRSARQNGTWVQGWQLCSASRRSGRHKESRRHRRSPNYRRGSAATILAVTAVGGMAQTVIVATGTPENTQPWKDAEQRPQPIPLLRRLEVVHGQSRPPPPGRQHDALSARACPAARLDAVGVGYWAGGWTDGPCQQRPSARRVDHLGADGAEAGGRAGQLSTNNHVTINRAIDGKTFLAHSWRATKC